VREMIHTEQAPKAVGPYSQAIRAGGFVFCSGQGGLDPATGKLVEGGIEAQTTRVLENLRAVLTAAGTSMVKAVKVNVYLKDMNDFAAMNAIYAKYFPEPFPARTTIEAARLPLDIRVEIEVIALV